MKRGPKKALLFGKRRFCAARRVARPAQGGRGRPTGANEMKRGPQKALLFGEHSEFETFLT